MSSDNSIPDSLSSDDLTSSQLDEYDSDIEVRQRDDLRLQSLVTGLDKITTALTNINITQQKYGENLSHHMKQTVEQNRDLLRQREQNIPASWMEYAYLTLLGITAFAALWGSYRASR